MTGGGPEAGPAAGSAPGLAAAAAAFHVGQLSAADLHAEFERLTLVVQRVEGPDGAPAVAAVGPAGAGLVAAHTSLEALTAYAGECDWAAASGADLLALVPVGYGVVVDPGGPCPVALPAAAIRRGVVVTPAGPPA